MTVPWLQAGVVERCSFARFAVFRLLSLSFPNLNATEMKVMTKVSQTWMDGKKVFFFFLSFLLRTMCRNPCP